MLSTAFALVLAQATSVELHPAFVFRSREEAIRLYSEGRKNTQISRLDYIRRWERDLGRVKSPEGWTFTTSNALLYTPVVSYRSKGHRDGLESNSPDDFLSSLGNSREEEIGRTSIRILAELHAWPGVGDNGRLTYSAKEEDVRDVKFVLLVDGKKERAIYPIEAPTVGNVHQQGGNVTHTDVYTVPKTTTTIGQANIVGSDGSFTSIYGVGTTYSTATYSTSSVEGFNAYKAVWSLKFPLYDPSGKPYVTKKDKSLVLKVIRPHGELSTTFKLKDFEK